jgi:Fuc2NAc and GlcNAc transferase
MSSLFFRFLLVPLFSAICSWLLLAVLVPRLHRCLIDMPNARSSHIDPTPRGGGIAFVVVASVASILACLSSPLRLSSPQPMVVAPLISLPLALVGLCDDRFNLPSFLRFVVQVLTAFLAVSLSSLRVPSQYQLPLLLFTLIVVTSVINFTNFMDGLDGLVAGCMSIVIAATSYQLDAPWSIWALVGALLGFLCWNWSPARVFMGDVGSTFLGAVYAVLVLQASTWSQALAFLLLATPLLGDACICVLRRLISGHRVFQAHRLHLFQRLHQSGWPHFCVSSLYIAATGVLAIALQCGGLPWVAGIAAFELFIGVLLDQLVAVRFSLIPEVEA